MENLNKLMKGWFSEVCSLWPGVALSLEVEECLYSKRSKFQQIDLYQTKSHGKMLALDGIIQLTEFDEFAYQEMLAHVPLFAHPDPRNILVIGGGDGGILREINRHACVRQIDFCEIDEDVIFVSKEFLPGLACGFDDPRVNVHVGDGNEFVKDKRAAYDVVIVDSSDPIGPGEVLFQKAFYEGLKKTLKPGGIIATQGESFFLHKDTVANLAGITRDLFPVQAYALVMVPTYPGGHIGLCMGSLGPDPAMAARPISAKMQDQLRYYSPDIHRAAFVLPHFAAKLIKAT